jgi:hypothetical protein
MSSPAVERYRKAVMKRRHWFWCLGLGLAGAFVGALWVIDDYGKSSGRPKNTSGLKYDPIEDDPAFGPMIGEANREAQRQLEERRVQEGRPGQSWLGDVHFFYAVKKQYLKDKYGIDWRTPAEMNPHIAID